MDQKHKFTNAEEEKLIQFIRSHEFIYNVQHECYTNRKLKQTTWSKLARNLKREVSECTKKWSNMRENYRKSIEELKTTGQISTNKRALRMKQLSFLADTMTNTRGIEPYRIIDQEQETLSESASVTSSSPTSQMQEPEIELHEDGLLLLQIKPELHENNHLSPPAAKRGRRSPSVTPRSSINSLQRYFSTICSTVAEFPIKDQIEMKIMINQIVYERELQLNSPIVYVDEEGHSDNKKYFQRMYEDENEPNLRKKNAEDQSD